MSATYNRSGNPPWLKEWRRKKAAGEITGPVAHLKYGKFSRPMAKFVERERPTLPELSLAEMERLETRL